MTSNLATKNDLLLVRQDLEHLEQRMVLRFDALESRFTLINQNLESRIVFKLGALMVVLVGLVGTLVKVLG